MSGHDPDRKYGIDSGWIVSETTACTCGMGRGSVYGHEAFCGLEQEAPVEEFDGWVKHMLAKGRADERGACASIIDDMLAGDDGDEMSSDACEWAKDIADRIRARGEKP